ncbi:MAG TPA: hydrogenase formation protein HypD [Elusimicrobia bacterium]|nr:hydrogenase formation protein HypD [Elusimicrobiota bacterium]HBW23207.1 hydrogenase formation protein HypD [Elusimicrobiota bacterium]
MKALKNPKNFESPLWRDKTLAASAFEKMASLTAGAVSRTGKTVSLMEVCGSHTMAIAASGMRRLFPKGLKMLSGPGCPVCVTAQGDIDLVLELAARPGVIIATFGDMLKVRGSNGLDLRSMREQGSDVSVVYSPMDALALAVENPGRQVVFVGVGFETTAPVIAGAVLRARAEKIRNFSVIPLFKLVPPALELLLKVPGHNISGFMLPGHVSAIIGLEPYRFVVEKYSAPCVVTGFEPLDILAGINMLLEQLVSGVPALESEYGRAVRTEGNPRALEIMREVFSVTEARWRSIGAIKKSGLGFSRAFSGFDAVERFKLSYRAAPEPKGCICGGILLGKALPADCGLFGKACSPSHAVGPCMVSSEGACAAWFKYGG